MDNEPVRLGRLNRAIEKAVESDLGPDVAVYVQNAELDSFASKWPEAYLTKLNEAGKILKDPDYAAYSPKKKTLFLIKEYLKDGEFRKVVLELEKENAWDLKLIYALTSEKAQEINSDSPLRRVR
jgi:hypothetical protein